jgi:hypothetical protein
MRWLLGHPAVHDGLTRTLCAGPATAGTTLCTVVTPP